MFKTKEVLRTREILKNLMKEVALDDRISNETHSILADVVTEAIHEIEESDRKQEEAEREKQGKEELKQMNHDYEKSV